MKNVPVYFPGGPHHSNGAQFVKISSRWSFSICFITKTNILVKFNLDRLQRNIHVIINPTKTSRRTPETPVSSKKGQLVILEPKGYKERLIEYSPASTASHIVLVNIQHLQHLTSFWWIFSIYSISHRFGDSIFPASTASHIVLVIIQSIFPASTASHIILGNIQSIFPASIASYIVLVNFQLIYLMHLFENGVILNWGSKRFIKRGQRCIWLQCNLSCHRQEKEYVSNKGKTKISKPCSINVWVLGSLAAPAWKTFTLSQVSSQIVEIN